MAIILLTPEQVGEILGRPSSWVTAAAREGKIPGRKVGSRWRFLESDVVDYLDSVATGGSKRATPVKRRRNAA